MGTRQRAFEQTRALRRGDDLLLSFSSAIRAKDRGPRDTKEDDYENGIRASRSACWPQQSRKLHELEPMIAELKLL
ncbi:MAG: hypothetical protein DMF48_04540 [Verrucomicrobia bacterium]|nr:MAG: hypothetical protein DMF48_04540 [Verrucomicrobiota bacterium]